MFGLANRVRAAAKTADLDDGSSGHIGHIGMARRIVAAGAPNAAVQRQAGGVTETWWPAIRGARRLRRLSSG